MSKDRFQFMISVLLVASILFFTNSNSIAFDKAIEINETEAFFDESYVDSDWSNMIENYSGSDIRVIPLNGELYLRFKTIGAAKYDAAFSSMESFVESADPEIADGEVYGISIKVPEVGENYDENTVIVIHGKKLGETEIKITRRPRDYMSNRSSGCVTIKVSVQETNISALTLDNEFINLQLNEDSKLETKMQTVSGFQVSPNEINETISFKSSNPSIVTIDEMGNLHGQGFGEAVVIAETAGFMDFCHVCVGKVATRITLNKTEKKIILDSDNTIKNKYQLKASIYPTDSVNKKIIWHSSNPSVAVVDAYGLVKALTKGETTITATLVNGISANCIVRVLDKEDNNDNNPEEISYNTKTTPNISSGKIKINGETATLMTAAVTYRESEMYCGGKAIKPAASLSPQVDLSALVELVCKKKGVSLDQNTLFKIKYVPKNNKKAGNKAYFYPVISLKTTNAKKKAGLTTKEIKSVRTAVKRINKGLKSKKNRCYFTIEPLNLSRCTQSTVEFKTNKDGTAKIGSNGYPVFTGISVKTPSGVEVKLPKSLLTYIGKKSEDRIIGSSSYSYYYIDLTYCHNNNYTGRMNLIIVFPLPSQYRYSDVKICL